MLECSLIGLGMYVTIVRSLTVEWSVVASALLCVFSCVQIEMVYGDVGFQLVQRSAFRMTQCRSTGTCCCRRGRGWADCCRYSIAAVRPPATAANRCTDSADDADDALPIRSHGAGDDDGDDVRARPRAVRVWLRRRRPWRSID